MTINQVLHQYENTSVEGTIRFGNFSNDSVVIEAPADGLRFIADLLRALADGNDSCHWDISPGGAGHVWLHETSPKGLMIHLLPCEKGSALDVPKEAE